MYQPRRLSRSVYCSVRGLRYHMRHWGPAEGKALVLLHGGWDSSATFQFMVDCLAGDWFILAPDWRGHGNSENAAQGYWFADYIADLDALIDQFSGGGPVPLVGHSLGGNVACIYAGLRPERVTHLISLDGFGLPDSNPADAPRQLRRWLDSWREKPRPHRTYDSIEDMAARLRDVNPRLDEANALFLAAEGSRETDGGGRTWAFDPRHRAPFAALHRKAEWIASVAEVRARTLFIGSDRPFPLSLENEPDGLKGRVSAIPGASYVKIEGAGHNLHHDEPLKVARLIENFLLA